MCELSTQQCDFKHHRPRTRDSPSLNSCRSLGFTNSGLTVSNHQKSSAMNTIMFCCVRNSKGVKTTAGESLSRS